MTVKGLIRKLLDMPMDSVVIGFVESNFGDLGNLNHVELMSKSVSEDPYQTQMIEHKSRKKSYVVLS